MLHKNAFCSFFLNIFNLVFSTTWQAPICQAAHQKKIPVRDHHCVSTVQHHRKEMRVCVFVWAWVHCVFAHTAERSRKLCAWVLSVGVGLLKSEKPFGLKRLRDQLFSVEWWCVTMQEASVIKIWARPTTSGPRSSVSVTQCLCNVMFMQWMDWSMLRWIAAVRW